jgi:hypothetical protein
MSNEYNYDYDEDGIIELVIGSSLNEYIAKKNSEDLAWEHATELARATNISISDEKFEEIYRELSLRYEHQNEHIKFFLMTAMMLVRELLESDTLSLAHFGDKISEEEIVHKIGRATSQIVASYIWLAAGYELTWPSNDELPEEIKLSFYFNPDDIENEEESWD